MPGRLRGLGAAPVDVAAPPRMSHLKKPPQQASMTSSTNSSGRVPGTCTRYVVARGTISSGPTIAAAATTAAIYAACRVAIPSTRSATATHASRVNAARTSCTKFTVSRIGRPLK